MKYRVTLLNTISGIILLGIIGFSIFYFNKPAVKEVYIVIIKKGLLLSILGFILDFIFQSFTQNLKTNKRLLFNILVVFIISALLYYNYRYKSRNLIVEISNDYMGAIGIVYNVPKAHRFPVNIFTLNSVIKSPNDGIIFTKSKILENDIPRTLFIRKDGTYVPISGTYNNLYSKKIELKCMESDVLVRITHLGKYDGENQINQKIIEIKEKIKKYCAQQRL